MKKFIWPLQRLLDVKGKQEHALRAELAALTEQSAALRSRIMMEKIVLRNLLDELNGLAPQQRMQRQPEFMQYVHVKDALLKDLGRQLEEAEKRRHQKMQDLLALRKFRKGLERLRQRALEDFICRLNRQEQNLSDENTCTVIARRMAAQLS